MKFWHIVHKRTKHTEVISDEEWQFILKKKPSWAKQYSVRPATHEQVTTFIPPEVLSATDPKPSERVRVQFALPKTAPEPQNEPEKNFAKFGGPDDAGGDFEGDPASEHENNPALRSGHKKRKKRNS